MYLYNVIVHKMNCFAWEGNAVDEDIFSQYLDTIRLVTKTALTLPALTSGFQTILTFAHWQSPMVTTSSLPAPISKDTAVVDEAVVPATKETTPPPAGPSRLASLNYILREIYDILSEDALNYPVRTIYEIFI